MTNNQRFAAELIVLLTFGAVLWSKASPIRQDANDVPTTLTAHSLLIVDVNGKPRAKLTADEDDAGLVLLDKDGKTVRGKFVVFPDPDHQAQYQSSGPTLYLADKSGQVVANLSTRSLGAQETTFLHLHQGDETSLHIAPVGKKHQDIDIAAGDNGTASIYMINVPKNKPSSWALLRAKDDGKSEAIATKFTPTTVFDHENKLRKGAK